MIMQWAVVSKNSVNFAVKAGFQKAWVFIKIELEILEKTVIFLLYFNKNLKADQLLSQPVWDG